MTEHKERSYPIYSFWISFTDSDHNLSNHRMFAEHLSADELDKELQEFIDRGLDQGCIGAEGEYTIRSLNLGIIGKGWKYQRGDTWCCQWFNHYTFNTHLTDEELLQSFSEYVNRHKGGLRRHEDAGHYRIRTGNDYVCLMGAQDHWRWKGICRCEHCQARGIVMIDH